MENFEIIGTDSSFEIHGIPDTVKIVRIDDHPGAKRLGDLALHRSDLTFSAASLDAINGVPETLSVSREALWRAAIVHFMKCFGRSRARFRLTADQVYEGQPAVAFTAFTYFKNLRDKHLVHDENSYAQSLAGAAINDGTKPYKVEKVICLSLLGNTLSPANFTNLHLLVHAALAWVEREFEGLAEVITRDLESEPYDRLAAREPPTYTAPMYEELSRRRS